ncbi:LysE family translocator [Paenibacillus alkalitolerans]|uniref:LysE family translocator n=1 Tax=Paenibacillus alkalitolerans TaxID=2799335 RepID=UPI0018F4E2C4|nr:LysE family transporter [Paenibacillus alkalitolerans]
MNITSFIMYCMIVTFTPGPTNILILNSVQNFGLKKVMQFISGATIAFGALLAASVMLSSALAAVVPNILSVVQIIGTFYMLYLAYLISKMDVSKEPSNQASSFLSGFLLQLINPKVILFTMTVIPSYVMPHYKSPHILSVFVAVVTVIGFSAFVMWALFGTLIRGVAQRFQKAANLIMALFLVYSAIMVSGLVDFITG